MQGSPAASDLVVRTRSYWYVSGTALKLKWGLHIICWALVLAMQT